MTQHLDPASRDTFAQQLSETPSTLLEAAINDNYCWDSSHPMGWDCYICRLQDTLPAFFEVVAMLGAGLVDVHALNDVADVKRFWIGLRAHNAWLDAHPEYGL